MTMRSGPASFTVSASGTAGTAAPVSRAASMPRSMRAGRDERPRAVVDGDVVALAERLETEADGVLAALAAGDNAGDFGEPESLDQVAAALDVWL